ncbi:hypothetical protein QA584_17450 [Anaerocolumna sp. AGMB13025]|uniref:hypothetical protein n=1 Tax=Anaerocolumna sp. AGMB13025 TaxID=3039116 RepID=UPI00241CBCC6|nr:hypothetical protein [Anaerocolumna sp. AGMB13025]WFR55387.1 hypothetical protein QA584_17450 [Anaerocolumna sp. AGMB13025]
MWLYKSPIGNIYIKRLTDGRYGMLFNGVVWESCNTPEAEADNVYMQVTGCFDWDDYDTSNIDVPSDLSYWIKINT